MLKTCLDIIEKYKNLTLFDEDENELSIVLNKCASLSQLEEFEDRNNIKLPEDFRDLLLYTNGLNLFGVEIRNIFELEYIKDAGICIFHDWGNGDFDCLAINESIETGSIHFMNHSTDVLKKVLPSFRIWIKRVIEEIEEKGVLLHPIDYLNNSKIGIYQNIELIDF